MASTTFSVKVESEIAVKALSSLSADEFSAIMDGVSQLLEDQTKQRLDVEKRAPDGSPWVPWSPRYAASLKRPNRRYPGSLLVQSNALLQSVQGQGAGPEARVGVHVVYAAIQQFGGRGIPARPYLGLSTENRSDIRAFVLDAIEGGLVA